MSIEELATMLGTQMAEAQAEAWVEGYIARARDDLTGRPTPNPYRQVAA